jgi:hypothetical protein
VPHRVILFVDPASEAHWLASRWLAGVEQAREMALVLEPAPSPAGRRAARVAVAAADLVGADGVRAVYEAYGRRRYVLGEADDLTAIADALADAELPAFLNVAGDDKRWDARLADAPDAPLEIDGVRHPLPDLAAAPVGADATALFDALCGRVTP